MRQLFSDVQLLLVVCCNVALLSSALGQADRPEVGREVSRIQRPTLFPMVTGEGVEAAVVGELPERKEFGRLRILYDTRPLPWLTTQIFSGAFYTTNAALLPNNEKDNWYFQQGFLLNMSKGFFKTRFTHMRRSISPGLSMQSRGRSNRKLLRDGRHVGATYVLKKLANLALSVHYTYERLANLELTDEIFHENHLIV